MRIYLIAFIAIVLSLNAAHAAATSICDAMEKTPGHGLHVGHHDHERDDNLCSHLPDTNKPDKVHFHDHAHPVFSFLLPSMIDGIPEPGNTPLALSTTESFSSASLSPPFHPPRAALA